MPPAFRRLLLTWHFGNLVLGPLMFGSMKSSRDYLLEMNTGVQDRLQLQYTWWGEGPRPANLLYIGGTEAYSLLLDTETGAISGFNFEDEGEDWTMARVLASDVEIFLCAFATLTTIRGVPTSEQLAAIHQFTGADPESEFWQHP
jgi:hypothetical protein